MTTSKSLIGNFKTIYKIPQKRFLSNDNSLKQKKERQKTLSLALFLLESITSSVYVS